MRKILQLVRAVVIILLLQCTSEGGKINFDSSYHDPRYVLGFVDRLEDNGAAVVLVEELNREFIIYPDIELQPNMWLHLYIANDEIIDLSDDMKQLKNEREKVDVIVKKLREEK